MRRESRSVWREWWLRRWRARFPTPRTYWHLLSPRPSARRHHSCQIPSAEQETDYPAIFIRSLLVGALVDPVVKSLENEACALESASDSNGEPYPEEEDQNKEDGNGNAKVSSLPTVTCNAWDQSDNQTSDCDELREPAFVENSIIWVVDLKCINEKVCCTLLSTGDSQNPGGPIPPL